MIHTNLPIYKKGYDLLSLAADVQLNMPRTFKQSLGKRVHDECVDLLLEIGYANASRGEKRCDHIRNVLRGLEVVSLMMRVSFDKGFISRKIWASSMEMPPFELLSDAQPVEAIPRTLSAFQESRAADTFATYTLLAKSTPGRSSLGNELFVLHQGRRDKMVERQRISTDSGFCLGLAEADFIEARCAGNAVVPQVAEWVAKHLYGAIRRGE